MSTFQLYQEQNLPITIEEAWEFISNPENLKIITPDYMGFKITSREISKQMYPGMIICYKVSPVLKIKTDWVTEITHIKDKVYFVDEQRIGPYKMWHHEHWLEQTETGVKMKDLITYTPPFGILGDFAQKLFIKKQLEGIFSYRKKKLEKLFC